MAALTLDQTTKNAGAKELQFKASVLDELVDFIEDKYLGYLMSLTEGEENITLARAKKLLQE